MKAVEAGERLAALALLAGSAPLVGICAGAVALLSGRSPFVAHLRVGLDGTPLRVLKLRTMWNGRSGETAEWGLVEQIVDDAGPRRKSAVDARVSSRFASFCRKYSLDELPQLLQVVSGEMALVGPRPITARELEEYYGETTAEVLSVKPGLTGLWQVMGRSSLSYRQRMRLDLFLVRRWSLGLYCKILWMTLAAVATGRDSI